MPAIVFFSNVSGYTHRFVQKLAASGFAPAAAAQRIPIFERDGHLSVGAAYILITPTYGGGAGGRGDVPKQVIRFLNDEKNRSLLRGVIGAGNLNFGRDFAIAADIIAAKCQVPLIDKFEVSGTLQDIERITQKLELL